jgi:hypothetical protein
MKRIFILVLVFVLVSAAAGCAASKPKEIEHVELPESAAAIPEGLSGAPFKLGENTYAFWRIVRYPADGDTTKYEIQVLQKEERIPVVFSIGSSGKSSPESLVHMKLGDESEKLKEASATNFSKSEEVPGYAVVISYGFLLNSGESLPETAFLFLADGKTKLNTQGEKLLLGKAIIIDAEPETSPASEQASTSPTESVKVNASIPKELVGMWKGSGKPVGGGSAISLDVAVNADATGIYTFEQAGYEESYPFILSSNNNSFSVSIPADNKLGISACGGTYSYSDGVLTLNITTRFSSGRQFKYVAECTKITD